MGLVSHGSGIESLLGQWIHFPYLCYRDLIIALMVLLVRLIVLCGIMSNTLYIMSMWRQQEHLEINPPQKHVMTASLQAHIWHMLQTRKDKKKDP